MKSRFLILAGTIISLFAGSCNNDLDIIDDWKETPVVYGLLNPASTVNYVRLQRAYLGEGNAYLMGQHSDSLYFDTNRVSVRVVRVGNTGSNINKPLDTLYCPVTTDVRKDEGVFSDAPHYLYKMNSRAFYDSRYQLYVNRHTPVGSMSVSSVEYDIFDAGASNKQFIVLVRNSELQEAGLKDGTILHSIGFLGVNVQSNATYSVTVSAMAVSGGLNGSALPNFASAPVLNSELMTLNNGWNDLFFTRDFALPAGSDVAFRICINPSGSPGNAGISFTSSAGIITFTRSLACGNNTAAATDERRPVLRLGYSGNGVNNRITFSESAMVSQFNSPTLASILTVNLANSEPFRIKCNSSKNAAIQGLEVRFNYIEVKNSIQTTKSVIYPLENFIPSTTNGGETFEFLLLGDAFFQYLSTKIPNDPNAFRPASAAKLDFIAKIGDLGFYTYYLVNQPGNSVYNQPNYTNIENGKGIFTCRLDSTKTNYGLSSATVDSLNFGRFTGHLFN